MTSRRLGIIVLALAAVWSLAGLDWLAPTPSETGSILSVQQAYAGDPDEVATSAGSGSVDDDPVDETPQQPRTSTEEDESLLEKVIQAIEALFGDH